MARDGTSIGTAEDAPRLLEGERFAQSYFGEMTSATRRLVRGGSRGLRRIGYQLNRHLAFNRGRLGRLYQGLDSDDRMTFALVPFLLHVNQPGLPGYHPAPRGLHGLAHFELTSASRQALEELLGGLPSFDPIVRHKPPFRSLWAETDVGTVAQRDPTRITFFIVLDLRVMGQGADTIIGLRCQAITEWGNRRGLELRFVLLDPVRCRSGSFDTARNEPARSAARLDAFYHRAVYLGGELPMWWCVPSGSNHAEIARSVKRAQLEVPLSFFDLGPVPVLPEGVRHRAATEALERQAVRPLAFLLDLTRAIVDAELTVVPLGDRLKGVIHGGNGEDPISDPWLHTFDAAAAGLDELTESAHAETLRVLAYLKTAMYLAQTTAHAGRFLDQFQAVAGPCVVRWGYDRSLLGRLDALTSWSGEAVEALDRDVRQLILDLYRRLSQLSRSRPRAFDADAVAALGRRLLAIVGLEAGRVRFDFGYLLEAPRNEPHLVILEQPDASRRQRWAVHRHVVAQQGESGDAPMHTAETLPAVAAWALVNRVFGRGTAVRPLGDEKKFGTTAQLREMFDRMAAAIGDPDPLQRRGSTFRSTRRIRRAVLVATGESLPGLEGNDPGRVRYIPENWDILNYDRGRQSKVRDVSVVTIDTWDAVFCQRFRGAQALMAALRAVYGQADDAHPLEAAPEILVHGGAARPIQNRLTQILDGADRVISSTTRAANRRAFMYEVGGQFQVLRRDRRGSTICGVRSLRGAMRLLGAPGEGRQIVAVDRLSPTLSEVRALIERHRTDAGVEICVGWRQDDRGGLVLVHDELGRLYARSVASRATDSLCLRIVRRIIHRLRTRVRDTRTLRRVLRVFEMRAGPSLGADAVLREDTVRAISRLARPRNPRPELFLRGQLRRGRGGIGIEYNGTLYSPEQHGRRFIIECVRALVADRGKYPQFEMHIEASTVDFGDGAQARERGVVKHLRLIDIYERLMVRALRSLRDGKPAVLNSENPFSRRSR